ncbi:MAG: hypothetical protein PVG99_03120 [Desulfobacteraceae bacterium]
MGEIKSTLDIIMEKTKNLTVTEEEKRAFKQQEMEGMVKGLIQKFLDGILTLDRFKIEITALQGKDKEMVDSIIGEESLARIKLEEDNEPMLKILESTIGMDTGPIRETLDGYEGKLSLEREEHEKALLERLKKRGISGSAVIPNIEADPEWRRHLATLQEAFRQEAMK